MAESGPDSGAKVHIVYTERPQKEAPEAYHLRTLSKLLGSEEAAKGSLIHSYNTAACGFSAKLTPEQVQRLKKQPGIIQIVPSQTYQLHGASGNRMNRPGMQY
ncbi:Proteinase inhibitor propeptide [Euphorbia peplus]|nr:Proteinase inhibitor propeptide [Euphorbia peplus]